MKDLSVRLETSAGVVYNSSKGAVIQLARSLAMEWGCHGIRVNRLYPGHVITPIVDIFQQDPAARAIWEAENMLGRIAMAQGFWGGGQTKRRAGWILQVYGMPYYYTDL